MTFRDTIGVCRMHVGKDGGMEEWRNGEMEKWRRDELMRRRRMRNTLSYNA